MFKRLEKRQEKRERNEELGLEDTVDSSSESDTGSENSDLGDGAGVGSDDELDGGSVTDMKMEWLAAQGEGSEEEDNSDEEGLALDDENGQPRMKLSEAVKDPIYTPSTERDEQACIVCPKKRLKNSKMVEVHIASVTHVRRFKKFCELAVTPKLRSKDPRQVVAAMSQSPNAAKNAYGVSNRGLKRQRKIEVIKEKRERTKQIIERKKSKHPKKEAREAQDDGAGRAGASESDKANSEKPRKKRRVSRENELEKKVGGSRSPAGDLATPADASETKTKAKAKAKGNADTDASEGTNSRPKSKLETSKSDLGGTGDSKTREKKLKRRDAVRIKGRGHSGAPGGGKFAKLAGTRPPKYKNRSGPELDKKQSVRKALIPGKITRYFDAPKEIAGAKEAGPKRDPGRKSNGKEDGNRLTEKAKVVKAGGKRKREAKDDLVVFD